MRYLLKNPSRAEVIALKTDTPNEFLRALEDQGIVYVWPDFEGDHATVAEALNLSSKVQHRGRFYTVAQIKGSPLFAGRSSGKQ